MLFYNKGTSISNDCFTTVVTWRQGFSFRYDNNVPFHAWELQSLENAFGAATSDTFFLLFPFSPPFLFAFPSLSILNSILLYDLYTTFQFLLPCSAQHPIDYGMPLLPFERVHRLVLHHYQLQRQTAIDPQLNHLHWHHKINWLIYSMLYDNKYVGDLVIHQ